MLSKQNKTWQSDWYILQLENDLFRYFCRYTPEVLKERHAIIEEIIKLAPKTETTE